MKVKRVLKKSIIFLFLLKLKIQIKLYGLQSSLKLIKQQKYGSLKYFCGKRESLEHINNFYRRKFFTCLICAIAVKKIFNEHPEITIHIGFREFLSDFKFHAWVKKSNKIIFGNSKNIDQYKALLSL